MIDNKVDSHLKGLINHYYYYYYYLKPLKTLQNKALRIITHTPQRISAKPLDSSRHRLKFEDIVKLQIAKSM